MDVRLLIIASLFCLIQSKVIKLTCEQKKQFVDRHNYLRLKLAQGKVSGQPAAVEMKSMIWDEEVAMRAANWASKDIWGHSPEPREIKRFSLGENMFERTNTNLHDTVDIDYVIDDWFNEHYDYTYAPFGRGNSNGKMIGHYTQVVWSDSTHLGCGIFEKVERGVKITRVVCNYGPAGNVLWEVPYKRGSKGSGALICEKNDRGMCLNPYGKYCNRSLY